MWTARGLGRAYPQENTSLTPGYHRIESWVGATPGLEKKMSCRNRKSKNNYRIWHNPGQERPTEWDYLVLAARLDRRAE